jgi:hypothetical protein
VQNEDRLRVTSDNLEVPKAGPEPWMLELAKMLILKDLPTGVIVGTAVISECRSQRSDVRDQEEEPYALTSDLRPLTSELYEWHMTDVERAKRFRKLRGHPQPGWFRPF